MAGDWIKVRTALANDGRVRMAAKTLKKSNALGNATTNAYCVTVLGALVTLWSFADTQADENGLLIGYDFEDINELVGVDGFCESLPPDWIAEHEGWVKLPEYQQHNGKSAKKRAQTAKRVANAKANATGNASGNADSVSEVTQKALPREEKRRDKENKQRKFIPPTIEDVSAYCAERGNGIDAQNFIDHYSANGWMRGKTKIKDWKACVRTWEQRSSSTPQQESFGAGAI